MVKKWIDHSLDMAIKTEKGMEAVKKAHAKVDKKLKKTIAQLSKVEKA